MTTTMTLTVLTNLVVSDTLLLRNLLILALASPLITDFGAVDFLPHLHLFITTHLMLCYCTDTTFHLQMSHSATASCTPSDKTHD